MDAVIDIPDFTDWLKTPLQDFAQLENALHCQICKEFYDTPMITSCSHSFCSKCIRISLSADGKCPACRATDQANKLRNNWALQEVVNAFQLARPAGIMFARKAADAELEQNRVPAKRKRSSEIAKVGSETGTTRRKSRRIAQSSQNSQRETIEVVDSDDDEDFLPDQVDDGLVECPLGCGKRMKIEQVEPHLDRCEDEKREADRPKSHTSLNKANDTRGLLSPGRSGKSLERLSELNYSMMKESALTKKLRELGIPAGGGKPLMVRRHTAWVNLWNANCDSSHPRSKPELLRELDVWERTLGGRAPQPNNLSSTIMRKDFDGTAWLNRNKDDFSRLIADARRKRTIPVTESLDDQESEPANGIATVCEIKNESAQPIPPEHSLQISGDVSSEVPTSAQLGHNPPETPTEIQVTRDNGQSNEIAAVPVLVEDTEIANVHNDTAFLDTDSHERVAQERRKPPMFASSSNLIREVDLGGGEYHENSAVT